ncbi:MULTISPECIES: hypothetical protein [Actinomycetes]|uniref:hypothetical protein n=2 Tax=Actinomycetota TaxID=201174 RepID=UPI003655971C
MATSNLTGARLRAVPTTLVATDAAVLAMLVGGDRAADPDSPETHWRRLTPVSELEEQTAHTDAADASAFVAELESDEAYDAAARREQLSLAWDMAQGDDVAEASVLADAAEFDHEHGLVGRVGSLYAELVADTLAVAA